MNLSREELLSRLQDMNGHRFEELVADIWEQKGWDTTVTSGSGDDGTDVIAEKDSPFNPSQKHIIQAKCYSDTPVSGSEIRNFRGALDLVNNADAGVFVTTSSFSSPAERTANRVDMNLNLVDGEDLCDIILGMESPQDFLSDYFDLYEESKDKNNGDISKASSASTSSQRNRSENTKDKYSTSESARRGYTYNPDPNPDTSSSRSGYTYNPDPNPDTSSNTDPEGGLLDVTIIIWAISGLITIAIIAFSVLTWSIHNLLLPSVVATGVLSVGLFLWAALTPGKEDDTGEAPPKGIQ